MREVRKKSIDSAVNKLLIKAHRQGIPLAWDRAEAAQPQCGFGCLAICCRDCAAGPCRVNPFAAEPQFTICGRNRESLMLNNFDRELTTGTASLAALAKDFGAEVDDRIWSAVSLNQDAMDIVDYQAKFTALGHTAAELLQAIAEHKTVVYGQVQPQITQANMGVLQTNAVNIIVHGHVPPQTVVLIVKAAAAVGAKVVGLCGNEISGSMNLPLLTNYDSQELPLLTGAVDELIVGSQCVMPATVALARQLGITTASARSITTAADAAKLVTAAQESFNRRCSTPGDVPEQMASVHAGYTAENSPELFAKLNEGYLQGRLSGLVYLGGCGNIGETHDAQFVALAQNLLGQGYLVATAGCAGTALAKAGLCVPDFAAASADLRASLPPTTPAVLNLGACHDAAAFLGMAQVVAVSNMPVLAMFPVLTHGKVLATAIGFAASEIPVFVNLEQLGLDSATLASFTGSLNGDTVGKVIALPEMGQIAAALAQVAASK